jgi:hypothetical protein
MALTVVSGTGRQDGELVAPREWERSLRRRLAGVLRGVASAPAHLADGTTAGFVAMQGAEGLAHGLAEGAEGLDVQVLAGHAAVLHVLFAQSAGALSRTLNGLTVDGRKAAELARAVGCLHRYTRRSLEAVELARTRPRARGGIPCVRVVSIQPVTNAEGTGHPASQSAE